ncbi:hypothetical protein HETIRDRAFT_322307 [Heterobasidion irregulare TC 32-1]|uniref:YCII-related domain-containing protein n=1 Tax=Heterobasidion irregulare (strain TC 32-1) TaxID=747525 RepID=W4K2N1_HETIT|nr:uncharacterized protein HETIRDRAFT_322307 [Heterobasidion irregulare TC 32-1]ETW80083.1 hypothetical protein HETIRDRAFT_322307 [Heterobasidion irregulare TC 32-1]
MSSTTPVKHTFIVYAPDKTDPGANARRLAVRPAHIERAATMKQEGYMKLGGAILTPESIASESAEKKMTGSVLFFHAETIDKVRKTVESDVYYTSNVWDVEKIVIAPYAIAGGSQWP